jgi:hypothetical protein
MNLKQYELIADPSFIDLTALSEKLNQLYPDITSFELHIHKGTKLNVAPGSFAFIWHRGAELKCECRIFRDVDPQFRAFVKPLLSIVWVNDLLPPVERKDTEKDLSSTIFRK